MAHNPKPDDVIDGRTVFDVEWYGPGLLRVWYASGGRLYDMGRPCDCPKCVEHTRELQRRATT